MAWTPKFTFSVTWDNITGKPLNYPTTWSLVGGKPSTFPSTWATVSGKPATATRWPTWDEVTGKPAIPSGTVTSVGLTAPTGLSVSGSPVTGSGTLALSYSSGYQGYTTAEANKLSGIAAGAQVNVATNLSQGTRTATAVPITSSTGSSATLSAATTSLAGVMSSADKTKLNGIAANATVGANWSTNLTNIPANITSWASITPSSKADTSDLDGKLDKAIPQLDPIAEIESGNYGTVMQPFRIGRNSSIDPPTFSTNLSPYLWLGGSGASGQQGALIAVHAASSSSNQQMAFRGRSASGWGPWSYLWHSGNFDPDDYLSKSGGGVVTGVVQVDTGAASGGLIVNRTNQSYNSTVEYRTTAGSLFAGYGRAGDGFSVGGSQDLTSTNTWFRADDGAAYVYTGTTANQVWHAGNFNPTSQPASNISSGTFAAARIPTLSISKTSGLQAALDDKAPVANPVFEGDLTVSTSLAAGGVIVERRNQPHNSSIEYKTTDGSLWAGYGNNGTIGFSVGGSSNLTSSNTWFKAQDGAAYVFQGSTPHEVYHEGNLSVSGFVQQPGGSWYTDVTSTASQDSIALRFQTPSHTRYFGVGNDGTLRTSTSNQFSSGDLILTSGNTVPMADNGEARLNNSWDTITQSGVYYNTSSSTAPTNHVRYSLLHMQQPGGQFGQLAIRSGADNFFIRRADSSGDVGGWCELYHTGNFDPSTKFDNPSGSTSQYIRGNGTLATFPSIPQGTVTSVTGGNGLSGSVTSSGSLTLGTPSNITLSSTNSVTTTSHTHNFAPGGTTAQYIRGNGSLATFPSIPSSSDYVATSGDQTGLSGNKTWTGNHTFTASSNNNSLTVERTGNTARNAYVAYSTSATTIYAGIANINNTTWGIGTSSNLTSGNTQFQFDTSTGNMSASGSISDSIGDVRKVDFRTSNNTITLASSDVNRVVEKSNNSSYTYTIPSGHGSHGDIITFVNSGTSGTLTINAATGVTIYRNGTSGNISVGPGSTVTVYRSATANRWIA